MAYSYQTVIATLQDLADPVRAKNSASFFKTGPGQYGEHDQFLGIPVPAQRMVAKKFKELPLPDIEKLLESPVHEHRLTALIILVTIYKKSEVVKRQEIFDFYLAHTPWINNWDLVDCSAEFIIGPHLADSAPAFLLKLTRSENIWERRIAMFAPCRNCSFRAAKCRAT